MARGNVNISVEVEEMGHKHVKERLENLENEVLWPAVQHFGEEMVKASKNILNQRLRHPGNSLYTKGQLESSIRIMWQNKSQLSLKVGADERIAPYAKFVEGGHYYSDEFLEYWGWSGYPGFFEGKRPPRFPGHWFIRTGRRIATEKNRNHTDHLLNNYMAGRNGTASSRVTSGR